MMWQIQMVLDQFLTLILEVGRSVILSDPSMNIAFAVLCLIGASGRGARACAVVAGILHLLMFVIS